MTRTDRDVRDEVLRYLAAGLDAPETPDSAFDVDGIVREIVTSHWLAGPDPDTFGEIVARHARLTTPPVPAGWMRDAAPRDPRERFLAACTERSARPITAANKAWSLIVDAWRVIEVADARAGSGQRAAVEREVWMAALRVAIFRAEHPEAPPVD